MRKTLSVLLVLIMLLSLCACGNNDSQAADSSTGSSQVSTEGTGGTEDSTGTTGATQAPTDAPTEAPTTPPTQAPTEAPTTPPATECSHSWKDATCTAPKTCTKCGATEGSTAKHNYSDGACTVCGAEDPNVPFTGNVWVTKIVRTGSSEEGEVLSFYSLNPTDFQGYSHKEYYSNENYSFMYYGSITHNGKTYYDFWMSSEINGIEWEDNGDTVKVVFAYSEPATELVLTRTGEEQFTVTSSTDEENIPVGTVFNQEQED